MQSASCLQQCGSRLASAVPSVCRQPRQLRLARVQSQSGRSEPFNEGAVQVKRLVDRDRLQMLGNKIDILDKFETEFGDPSDEPSTSARPAASAAVADAPAASTSSSSTTTTVTSNGGSSSSSAAPAPSAPAPAAPAAAKPAAPPAAAKPAAPAAVKTNFGGSGGVASPFGTSSRTRSMMEPKGLSPDMSPDPIVKLPPTPGNLISRITLTQVVLFCTFSSMIGLMLATFSVVVKSGAVRLAGIE